MQYVLRQGFHYERNPDFGKPVEKGKPPHPRFIQHTKGAKVESDEDLCTKFPNKFDPVIDDERPEVVTEARRALVQELIQSGAYGDGDRRMLETLTPAAFDRVRQRTLELVRKAEAPDGRKVSSPLGEDVTDTFQVAYDEGLKVFVNAAGKYQVTRAADVKKPVNKNALTKDGVESFVKQFLAEEAGKGQG